MPGHDPLRLSCDSGMSPFDGGGALVMSLDSLAGWSSAQRARSPSAALRCRPRGSSRLGDFKSFSALFRRGGGGEPPNRWPEVPRPPRGQHLGPPPRQGHVARPPWHCRAGLWSRAAGDAPQGPPLALPPVCWLATNSPSGRGRWTYSFSATVMPTTHMPAAGQIETHVLV